MKPAQLVQLVDAAFRNPEPITFLDAVVVTFESIGQRENATATALIGYLIAEGEIEALMSLRAAWRRGQARSIAEVAGSCILRIL